MNSSWDGIYAVYMTGSDGQGFGMFSFRDGKIHGADPMGVRFGGRYQIEADGTLVGNVRVVVGPSDTVIQGVTAGPGGIVYEVPIRITQQALAEDFVKLDTPLGAVNFKLEKLHDFGDDE